MKNKTLMWIGLGVVAYLLLRDKEEEKVDVLSEPGPTPPPIPQPPIIIPEIPEPIVGCTDPSATNFDLLATADSGMCEYPIVIEPSATCQDPTALNYDPSSPYIDNSLCSYGVAPVDTPGCMDDEADNYDASATSDNGSCSYSMDCYPNQCISQGVPSPIQTYTGLSSATCPDQTSLTQASCGDLPGTPGCIDNLAENYNSNATEDDGSCTYSVACYPNQCISQGVPSPIQTYTGQPSNSCPAMTDSQPASCGQVPVIGCNDPNAYNYDPNATQGC